MLSTLTLFINDLYKTIGNGVVVNVVLQFGLSLSQGIGLLLLLPLLVVAGFLPDDSVNPIALPWFTTYFNDISLVSLLLLFCLVMFAHAMFRTRQTLLAVEIENDYANILRVRLYRLIYQGRWTFLQQQKSAQLNHVITNEIHRVANLVKLSSELLCTGMVCGVYIVVGLILQPALLLLALGCGLVLFVLLRSFNRQANAHGVAAQGYMAAMYASVGELLTGLKTIKGQGMEADMQRQFNRHCQGLAESNKRFGQAHGVTALYHEIGTVIFVVVFVYISLEVFAVNGAILLLLFVTFARLMPRLSLMLRLYQQLLNQLPAFTALQTLQSQCELHCDPAYDAKPMASLVLKQHIEVKNIDFNYCDKVSLRGVNLTIPAQATVALVGASGAGKSTLVDIIAGLLVPTDGCIAVDGQTLDDHNRLAWRKTMSYVTQEPFLFHDSIANNLKMLNASATDEQLWQALDLAAAKGFVSALPLKLDTVVGDRGIKLSGGEKQRIALARALVNQPQLLILDEATSALDSENERFIQQAIEQLHGKMTIVLVAHRLTTLRNADFIYVLEQGKLIEQGRWEDLTSNKNGRFAAMVEGGVGQADIV